MDGIDIRQLDTGELRHAISYVPKNFDLFYGSVAQNLRLANPTATDEHVQTIAEDSGLLDPDYEIFLPEGVETRLTNQRIIEMPNDLKQRIILARAFIKPAPFFLFDSPAQDLNAVGKEMFIHKLNQLRGNSTVIMLTQREDLIEQSDRVIGMVNGQIEFDVPVSRYLRVKQKSTAPVPPEQSPRNQSEFRTESAM